MITTVNQRLEPWDLLLLYEIWFGFCEYQFVPIICLQKFFLQETVLLVKETKNLKLAIIPALPWVGNIMMLDHLWSMPWFLHMQKELTELLYVVFPFNQDRVTRTELYVLMKTLTKPEKYIWNHYFLTSDSKQQKTVILEKGLTDDMSHATDTDFYLETLDGL